MKIETFAMERMQSTWENVVDCDLSESGTRGITLAQLIEWGFELGPLLKMRLGYSQTNGTVELRERIAALYPGATADHVMVTNGTSEANYLIMAALLADAEANEASTIRAAFELPNYLQVSGLARYWVRGGITTFHLHFDPSAAGTHGGWRLDRDEVAQAIGRGTRVAYITHPNNPTGAVMPEAELRRLVEQCDRVGAWLVVDEVYLGTEIDHPRTPTAYGLGERVIVTSGLSKAYGIPGVRIGWMVGPPPLAAEVWRLHDYTTIGPGTLSDAIARFAVRSDIRERLYARTADIVRAQLPLVHEFVRGANGALEFATPYATAMAFMRYCGPGTTAALCERLLSKRSTLVVDGALLGLDGYLRLWSGAPKVRLVDGLSRIQAELKEVTGPATVGTVARAR